MVEFDEDNDSQTSGSGKFLTEVNSNLNYIDYPNRMRCNPQENLVIDLPPHNSTYFSLQLEAVRNYYLSVSNKDISYGMLENTYQIDKKMSYYATSDQKIGLLFAESLDKANEQGDIDNYLNSNNLNYEDVLFVIFHAGLGQEASQRFDPTIYDIKSAYVDDDMLEGIQNDSHWINQHGINQGIVMPETLNWIFYNVIEDIFSLTFVVEDELDDLLCGQQLGMTGLFAHLLGYYFDFPLMTNNEGRYGIGDFGLMDQGCFNQQGIIPAKPNPWTRSNDLIGGWKVRDNKTKDLFLNAQIEVTVNTDDSVYQFDIDEDEYYLIENRYNKLLLNDNSVYNNKSIDCIIDYYRDYPSYCPIDPIIESGGISEYDEENDNFKHLYDVINQYGTFYANSNELLTPEDDLFQIQSEYNVITNVDNYDYGLPGSGILIWHIKEPHFNNYKTGINNSAEDRAIVLEEADGIQQVGGPDYEWFPGIDYTQGRQFDFWYDGNEQYEFMNYSEDEDIYKPILFNYNSQPNTRTVDNLDSHLYFKINDSPSTSMDFIAKFEYNNIYTMEYIKDDIFIIGNSPDESCLFYNDSNDIVKLCSDGSEFVLSINDFIDSNIDFNLINESTRVLVKNNGYYLVENFNYYIDDSNNIISFESMPVNPIGYYNDLINTEEVINALSIGDIDSVDEYDEKLTIDSNGTLHCFNNNDTNCLGFPVYGLFSEIPLIVDLLNGDDPEIIVKNGDYISIISNKGEVLHDILNYNDNSELQIIPNWGNSNNAALVNGNRLIIFNDFNENNSYWYNYYSTSYNFPLVNIDQRIDLTEINSLGIDVDRAYNYPNPIEKGYTKFRFFVYNATSVSAKIYDSLGFLVKTIESSTLTPYEYNELYWDASNVDSGLYFAELQSNLKESKLIKVVVIK